MIRPSTHRKRGWRRWRWIFTRLVVVLFILLLAALHVVSWMFGRGDRPERLNGRISLLQTNGFTIRRVEKFASNAAADIVFVHGSPGGAGVWRAQFAEPYPGANLIAYDRPGFGWSRPMDRHPHLQEQADALAALVRATSSKRVILVGHSYGSPVSLLAALEHPDMVSGVLLIGGDVEPDLENVRFIQRLADWPVFSWLVPRDLRQCNREMLSARADLAELQRLLPQLSCPVVMLHGGRDPLVPVANVDWLRDQLAAIGKSNLFTQIVYPDFNHFIPWEHPEAVREALQTVFQKADRQQQNNR